MGWRTHHSSLVMGLDDLIVWGGSQDDLPYRVHDNQKKRLLTTRGVAGSGLMPGPKKIKLC